MNFLRLVFAIILSVVLTARSLPSRAGNVNHETRVTFDMASRQIKFFGIYSPDSGEKRGGLDAEIVARRNGIASLASKMQASCSKDSVASGTKNPSVPSWQSSVKSLGSEIYSNGVLKIALVAPIREVFKESGMKPVALKSGSGAPLALKFPQLSFAQVKCGVIHLNVSGRHMPISLLSGSSDAEAKVVQLALDGNQLKPASPADAALLEKSNLFSNGESKPTPEPSSSASPAAEASPVAQ